MYVHVTTSNTNTDRPKMDKTRLDKSAWPLYENVLSAYISLYNTHAELPTEQHCFRGQCKQPLEVRATSTS